MTAYPFTLYQCRFTILLPFPVLSAFSVGSVQKEEFPTVEAFSDKSRHLCRKVLLSMEANRKSENIIPLNKRLEKIEGVFVAISLKLILSWCTVVCLMN